MNTATDAEKWDAIHKEREWGTCPEPAMARFASRRIPRGGLVLDIGCGVGAQAFWLLQEGWRVRAIDASPAAIERAILRRDWYDEAVFDVGDICALPADDEIFDAVIDVCCLQHVQDIDKALREIARVLKPGGWLFSMTATVEHSEEALGGMWARRVDREAAMDLYRAFNPNRGSWCDEIDIERATHTDRGRLIAHWLIEARKA